MIRKLASLFLKAITAVAVVGFVIIPPLLHIGVSLAGNQLLTKEVKLGAVYFNPFTLNLTLVALDIEDTAQLSSISIDAQWQDLAQFIFPPSGQQRTFALNSIQIDEPATKLILDKNGIINVAALLAPTVQEPQAIPDEPGKPVHFLVRETTLRKGKFQFTDHQYTHKASPFHLTLDHINLVGHNIGWPESSADITINTHLNDSAILKSQLHLQLAEDPFNTIASGAISLKKLNLPDFQPIISKYANAELKSGNLNVEAQVNWQPTDGIEIESNASVDKLRIDNTINQEPVVRWQHLQVNGLAYRESDNRLTVQQIALSGPEAVIAIDENLQVNLAALAKETNSTAQQPSAPGYSPESSPEKDNARDFSLAIKTFSIANGAMDFSDRSFEPGFATPIVNLNGKVSGFDSKSQTPATIDIAGRVDRYAPVTIQGAINPSSPLDQTNLSMSFKNLELTTLTPYSGRFAGYSIQKGRMHLDLNYGIRNHQLSATNEMLLDKLILGSKVDSDESVDLPIRLAIALLKDRNGQIDIKLPVSGDLDNPEFKLGPIIRTALFNLITNLISAPFDLLASLVGGSAEEMQFINFAPGEFSLQQYQQIESLDKLAKALQERPELQLEVTGKTANQSDWPLVAEKLLNEQLYKSWINTLESQQQPIPESTSLSMINPDIHLQLLTQVATKMNDSGRATIALENNNIASITEQLIQQWPYNEAAMRELAIDRAKEIKDYLMNEGGLAPERIYLLDVQHLAKGTEEQIATELQLDAG
ncbi:DUF748 domain-containing protein [uncultured Endozoicomonas sp.]|uniref:DUF748 domain-containing protein n=1 Tax=uncultured Endozoicomonas sp. TaxID=432652 RepID=UPI00262D9FEA|nr:DUF748 domain-containing protein [uncultured Endozoicomonas sp.]